MKKRLLIGAVFTDCNIDFQEEILNGIILQAFKANCNIAVLAPLNNFFTQTTQKQTEREIFKLILSDRFDGFIYDRNTFFTDEIRNYIEELLLKSGKPVMIVDHMEHNYFESTAIDDCSAFEEITTHLIEKHGFRKIYCLTGPPKEFVSEERLRGYQNSMREHNCYYDKGYCIYGDFWTAAAEKLAAEIINGTIERPEAVVCGNDYSAIALINALAKGGIKVPQDIAVTGYDASVEGLANNPVITSYRRPNFRLGADAFRRLYHIITGKICQKAYHSSGNTGNFRAGESCGCEYHKPPAAVPTRNEKINSMYEKDLLHRDMLFDITNTSSPEEFADRLDNYTYYLHKLKQLYICLTRKYMECHGGKLTDKLTFEAGNEMNIILSKSSSHRKYDEFTEFNSLEILPVFEQNTPHPSVYFISPLNFNENFFGYSAISFGKLPITYSSLYLFWINYINVALEQVRIKSILDRTIVNANLAMLYDESTGILNRSGVKQVFSENIGKFRDVSNSADFIRIQLTGLNDANYQSDDDKCARILLAFSRYLRECVREDEVFGIWSVYSFAVITPYRNRADEIFTQLSEKIRNSQFKDGENCNINFIVGADEQPLYPQPSPGVSLHQASLRRLHSYTVLENTENPHYEKLCQLRRKIMKNPELPWNINDISAELYLSKSYLQKMYKVYFGKSIIEEMIAFRLEKAKEQLVGSDITVTEISRLCGYSSYNYFVRQFKTAEGISPSEYRVLKTGKK